MGIVLKRLSFRFAALSLVASSIVVSSAVVCACESDPPGEGPDASEAEDANVDAGPTCGSGLVACGGACVSTENDPKHCGACDQACGADEVCQSGGCKPACRVDGVTVAAGVINSADACAHCDPAVSRSEWSRLADGTSCGVGKLCASGACDSQCFINGAFYAANAANPANNCEQCSPATSTATWTARTTVTLLTGGEADVASQGWSVATQAPSTLTNGPDYVRLQTSTTTGARTSGALLLYYPGAVAASGPFKVQVVMLVEAVTPHNTLDSAAAIMGAFTPPFGAGAQRGQMVYLDSAVIGWAEDNSDNPSSAFSVLDNAYHTYELSVDAANVSRLSVDGVPKLTRAGFVGNGTIAIGDQTNDPNVDSTLRIRSVSRVCP